MEAAFVHILIRMVRKKPTEYMNAQDTLIILIQIRSNGMHVFRKTPVI